MQRDLTELMTLSEAARRLPRRRGAKPTHPGTLYRWATTGLKGVRLEVTKVGGTICVSAAALERFFQALTALDPRLSSPPPEGRSSRLTPDETERGLDGFGVR
jgi:hypothetical protein